MSDDERYMREALREAVIAEKEGEVPVGAVLVGGGRIVVRTHNQTERLNDCTAHAEMLALTAGEALVGSKVLGEMSLYVTLEPCVMCAGAIGLAHLGRLVYGASDEKGGFSVYAPKALHPKTVVVGGVMGEECKELLQDFFQKRREH